MRLALAQQNRVPVPNRPGRTMPADQAKLSYAFTHGLAPMLYGAAKGTVASIPGVVGDVNELLRDYAVPYLPTGVQQALAKAPAPFTTEQYANMFPKMGGHTEDVATKLGSNVVGTIVDPFAVVGAVKRAPAVARSLAETANNKILQGESLIPGVPASVTNPPMMFAVKPKGGNWVANDIERNLKPLKQDVVEERLARELGLDVGEQQRKAAVNNWVDKKLGSYIRNEMGTPDDSILRAHERGYTHLPESNFELGAWLPDTTADMRRKAGFPEEGVALAKHEKAGYPQANENNVRRAELWENLADTMIGSQTAGEFQSGIKKGNDVYLKFQKNNPWIEKLDPNEKIYSIDAQSDLVDDLGFRHLTDELNNSVDPNSGLPQQLRWKPEDLSKVTVEQAVERVDKINKWRAGEAEKAERAGMMDNLSAAPRLEVPEAQLSFVDKPGMKWIDIPDTAEKSGNKLCTTIGRQGGWCTQGEGMAKAYGSGQSRLTALLDAEGRPHAQAKITQQSPEMQKADFLGSLTQEQYDRVLNNNGPIATQMYEDWAKRNPPKPNITELKPVGNEFSSARAQEYEKRDPRYKQVVQQGVLDFLNKGDWGKARDLDHYDIFDLADPKSLNRGLEDVLGDYHLSHERASIFNAAVSETPDANRFMNRSQLQQFVSPYSIEPNAKPEGYKDGGGVSASDSDPSLQFYSRTMDNPDSSKTTEQGIVKQFEQDYMKFALQRHQAPARSDIPNAQAPAARTNIYGEYGTPAMGGMVSGRVTKLGQAPDTYMGDLAYRTKIGPGTAHVGVQGMQSPQMPARMTGYNAGYGLPLGDNGFAGVNVMQPAQGGKPVFGANLQYRRQFAKGGAVRSLESNLPKLPKTDYKSIDELMTEISKRHKTAPKKLHDDFVEKHRMTPDTWIKRK
jgi:hypothetical protein